MWVAVRVPVERPPALDMREANTYADGWVLASSPESPPESGGKGKKNTKKKNPSATMEL